MTRKEAVGYIRKLKLVNRKEYDEDGHHYTVYDYHVLGTDYCQREITKDDEDVLCMDRPAFTGQSVSLLTRLVDRIERYRNLRQW